MTDFLARSSFVRGLSLALCALAAAACGRATADAEPTKEPAPVLVGPDSVATVERQRLSTGPRVSGTLEPEEQALIRAEASGSVVSLDAQLGAKVERGQVLLRISAAPLQDAFRSAQSAVRAAEQALSVAERQRERTARLNRAGALSARDLELEENAVVMARANLADMQARLASAREQLENATVRAPLTGVVSEQPVHQGDVVSPGTHLLTVINPQSMRLEASVPSQDLRALAPGAAVSFAVRGYPGRTFEGKITRVAPAANPLSRQVPILVSIPNQSGTLLAGLFADGRILAQSVEAPSVPFAALDRERDDSALFVLRGGKVERVPVELGVEDAVAERVEVRSGVSEGDKVLIGDARRTAPGTPVRLLSGAREAAKPSAAAPSATPEK